MENDVSTQTVGLIGLGQMARALARGWRSQLKPPPTLIGFDPAAPAREAAIHQVGELSIARDNVDVVDRSGTVVLAVKPQVIREVARDIHAAVSTRHPLIISIAAGIPLDELTQWLGTERVVRVMPNTPCLVGEGASGFACGSGVEQGDRERVERLLSAVGICFALPEKLLDAVTGLSGSGPAYVFVMIEALADGGVQMGLPRHVAQALAIQTVLGAAKLAQQEQAHPAELKDRVASPAGTTIAGLAALEQHGLRSGLMEAVAAATQRSIELGQRR